MMLKIISWIAVIGVLLIVGILSKYNVETSKIVEVLINFLSATGVVGALIWSIKTTQDNHELEAPELFINCHDSWSSINTDRILLNIINGGKIPALKIKIYISSDKDFANSDKFYCDYADIIFPGEKNRLIISTHKFVTFDLKRPYKKGIDITRCVIYDSGDDFFKSYIRLEYVSMYNKDVRHKNFTIFFDPPQEQQQDSNKIYTYKQINSVEGLI